MNQEDETRIHKIIQDRKRTNQSFSERGSKVYKAFLEMERLAFTDGCLSKQQKELIALGISVVINCEPCMEWHIQQALLSGATEEQIVEAVEVGIEMGGGPATVSSRFALKALEYHLSGRESRGLADRDAERDKRRRSDKYR